MPAGSGQMPGHHARQLDDHTTHPSPQHPGARRRIPCPRRAKPATAHRLPEERYTGRRQAAAGDRESPAPAWRDGNLDRVLLRPATARGVAPRTPGFRHRRRHSADLRPGRARRPALCRSGALRQFQLRDPAAAWLNLADAGRPEGPARCLCAWLRAAQPDGGGAGEGRADLRRHPADPADARRCRCCLRARQCRYVDDRRSVTTPLPKNSLACAF